MHLCCIHTSLGCGRESSRLAPGRRGRSGRRARHRHRLHRRTITRPRSKKSIEFLRKPRYVSRSNARHCISNTRRPRSFTTSIIFLCHTSYMSWMRNRNSVLIQYLSRNALGFGRCWSRPPRLVRPGSRRRAPARVVQQVAVLVWSKARVRTSWRSAPRGARSGSGIRGQVLHSTHRHMLCPHGFIPV